MTVFCGAEISIRSFQRHQKSETPGSDDQGSWTLDPWVTGRRGFRETVSRQSSG